MKSGARLESKQWDDGDVLVWDQLRERVLGLLLRSFLDVFSGHSLDGSDGGKRTDGTIMRTGLTVMRHADCV